MTLLLIVNRRVTITLVAYPVNPLPDFSFCSPLNTQRHWRFQELCYNRFPTVFLLLNVQYTRSTLLRSPKRSLERGPAKAKWVWQSSRNICSGSFFPHHEGKEKRSKRILHGTLKKKIKESCRVERIRRKPKAEKNTWTYIVPQRRIHILFIFWLWSGLRGSNRNMGQILKLFLCPPVLSKHQLPLGILFSPYISEHSYIFIILHIVQQPSCR